MFYTLSLIHIAKQTFIPAVNRHNRMPCHFLFCFSFPSFFPLIKDLSFFLFSFLLSSFLIFFPFKSSFHSEQVYIHRNKLCWLREHFAVVRWVSFFSQRKSILHNITNLLHEKRSVKMASLSFTFLTFHFHGKPPWKKLYFYTFGSTFIISKFICVQCIHSYKISRIQNICTYWEANFYTFLFSLICRSNFRQEILDQTKHSNWFKKKLYFVSTDVLNSSFSSWSNYFEMNTSC